jgi:hypothetical protein
VGASLLAKTFFMPTPNQLLPTQQPANKSPFHKTSTPPRNPTKSGISRLARLLL